VPGLSLDTLLERHAQGARVAYWRWTWRAPEADLLRDAGEWARRVACINVEVHHPLGVDECERDLLRSGSIRRPIRATAGA
jgi:hypothetical protein